MAEDNRLDAPREDLVRMVTRDVGQADDGNTLVGYAAVFNEWTTIDSWEGQFEERVAPGAFKKTLSERGDKIRVQFNHGMDPSIGDKPLGKPRVLKEDATGLWMETPLSDTSYNADIKALLRDGALDGMSIRMTVMAEAWDNIEAKDGSLPQRTIKEIRLHEAGPVTFPAYLATTAGIRAGATRAYEDWRKANPDLERKSIIPTAADQAPGDEQIESADPPVTDANSEPAGATREADEAPAPVAPYQPARRAPMTPETRRSQLGLVAALVAQSEKRELNA